ncbi:MAG: hypothetical protein M1831_005768 [Alyxoria varia]|nr:MAG: hypothetical protein M1831_005768 [Alyxoria varia]
MQPHCDLQKAFALTLLLSKSLDLIRSARSGNEAHTKQLLSTLTALHSSLTESPQSAQSKRQELKKRNAPLSQGPVFSMPTPPGSILARPYPTTSGPRHVPFLISAAGYPMLRTKKPQPPGLGPYFRKLTKKRQAQTDAVTRLEGMIPIARLEDVWDLDMQRQGVLVQASQRSQSPSRLHTGAGSWVEDLRNVIKHIQEKGKAQIAKKAELTKRMQWIVEEESRLARLEEEERRAGKTIEGPTGAQDAKDT